MDYYYFFIMIIIFHYFYYHYYYYFYYPFEVIADLMYLGYFTLSLSRVLEDVREDVPISRSGKILEVKPISDQILNIFWQLSLSFLVLPRPSIRPRDSTRNIQRRRSTNNEQPGLVDLLFS